MFVCSRCGSSFSAKHVGIEDCPRCRLRDKVEAPLAFKPFDLSGIEMKGSGRPARVHVGQSTEKGAAEPAARGK